MIPSESNGLAGVAVDSAEKFAGEEPQPPGSGKVPLLSRKYRPRSSAKENRQLFVIGGGIVLVLLLLAFSGISKRATRPTKSAQRNNQQPTKLQNAAGSRASLTPILDLAPAPDRNAGDQDGLNSGQIAATAKKHAIPDQPRDLGSIAPFDGSKSWRPPAYQRGPQARESADESPVISERSQAKSEAPSLDKPALVFVRKDSASSTAKRLAAPEVDWGTGLLPGTRLRARLESAVSTAVPTPVVAVVEFNYEQSGEIVVPAGTRVFGHVEAADRSGYLGIRFDSLTLPDGSSMNLQAAATDLELRPLRGRVGGRHTGKNLLVRSLAGVGEIAATLVGRGSLNQPLSENDLLRERVSNNLGQASDQTVANLASAEHPVISLSAGSEIYIVLEKSPRQDTSAARAPSPAQTGGQINLDQLRQLLQLQSELSQANTPKTSSE